jgi:NAD(P)-dependent dehydrogenase (short-subunit alcohol dehydrogenase family)
VLKHHLVKQSRHSINAMQSNKETSMLLKDKVAVVTGGAGLNGLGFATARMMAAQGAKVVILDLEVANPQAAAAQLGADQSQVRPH